MWSLLKNGMQNSAEEILGKRAPTRRNQWFDEECKVIIERKNAARIKVLNNNTRGRREKYNKERKEAKKLFRRKKKEHFANRLRTIESERLTLNPRKFNKEIKLARSEYNPRCKFIRTTDGDLVTEQEDIVHRWMEYYTGIFTVEVTVRMQELGSAEDDEQEETSHDQIPDIDEVRKAIGAQKNNRAPGIDAITGEMMKYAGNTTTQILHKIIANIWKYKKRLPEEWDIGTHKSNTEERGLDFMQ